MATPYMPSLVEMARGAGALHQMDEIRRQNQVRTRLGDILSNPNADIGSPTTLREIMAIDPSTALSLQKNALDAQKAQAELGYKQVQAQKAQTDIAGKKHEFVIEGAKRLRGYLDTLPPDQHQAALEQLYPQFVQSLGQTGAFDPAELQDMLTKKPDLQAFYGLTGGGIGLDVAKTQQMEAVKLPYDLQREQFRADQQFSNQAALKGILSADAERHAQATEAAAQNQLRKQNADIEMRMSDDYKTASKDFIAVRDAYKRLQSALPTANRSAPATLAAATTFMKLLDPGSVVRESELGMALAASGALDRFANYFNTLKNGRVLTANQVRDFQSIADKLYQAAEQSQTQMSEQFRQRATDYGVNPEHVIMDFSAGNQPGGGGSAPIRKTARDRAGNIVTFELRNGQWVQVQ
jgi:hypothetical protein